MLTRSLLILLASLAVWFALTSGLHLPNYLLPTPTATLTALWQHSNLLAYHTSITLFETLSGLLLGSFCGLALALLMTAAPKLAHWIQPIIMVSQSIPLIVLAPLLILWLGYGIGAKILITALIVFFPITHTTYDGLIQTDPAWIELAQNLRAKPLTLLFKLRLPAALPQFIAGLKIASVYAPMGAIISEWVGAQCGLGYLLLQANANMQIDLMFACVFTLIALTFFLRALVRLTIKPLSLYCKLSH